MKIRTALYALFFLFTFDESLAQAPVIEWQKCLGWNALEYGKSIQQTFDGGYIIAGYASTPSTDIPGNHNDDFWLIKMSSFGDIEWQRCLGGTGYDYVTFIQQTSDSGYIVTGYTNSTNGDVQGNHSSIRSDIWVVKLNSGGAIQWQRCLGGTQAEDPSCIQQTNDGGYIISGYAQSTNGDVTCGGQTWIVKLGATGILQWQICFTDRTASSIRQTPDGGYIFAGSDDLNNGNLNITKLNAVGQIEWERSFGGTDGEFANTILQTSEGGFIIAGQTYSNDGIVSGYHGEGDGWVLRTDSAGNLLWQKCLGGSAADQFSSLRQVFDGGFILAGATTSNDGDVSGNHGQDDIWIVKLDSIGNLVWQKCLGSTGNEFRPDLCLSADGGCVITGSVHPQNGIDNNDVSGYHGGSSDLWLVKLKVPKIKTELEWDFSFPTTSVGIKGVAADGVSRIYLKVNKTNENDTLQFQNVQVTLRSGDGGLNSTAMLGKVQAASIINHYSTEANNANSITATSSTLQSGSFWFWYVAPNDFSDNINYTDTSEREIKAHILVTFTNNARDSIDVPIKIVRPPLVMVHGLAGNEHSWDSFRYGDGKSFLGSELFKQKKAVRLSPNASFKDNAETLLSPDLTSYSNGSFRLNTLQGNIDTLRKQGYACNQADYVCHSMGGCVLRTSISLFPNKFYGSSNEIYKNYGKGFVHKAIIISTPHNGSPIADLANEFIPIAPDYINWILNRIRKNDSYIQLGIEDFVEHKIQGNENSGWQPTPAVINLQTSRLAGGINQPLTHVTNHLLAGDVNIDTSHLNEVVDEANVHRYQIEIINCALKIMRNRSEGEIKKYLDTLLEHTDKRIRVLKFIEWYSHQKGFPNFLEDGDLIVPLRSQTADLTTPNSAITVFSDNLHHLDVHHMNIKNRTDVGTTILNLLNSKLSDNVFASEIPAAPVSVGDRLASTQYAGSQRTLIETSSFDTIKVKILTPVRNEILPADSSRTIKLKLKDTVDLAYVDLYFQGQTYTSKNRDSIQNFIVKIDSSYIGSMALSATAVYDKIDGTDYHTDTLTVHVINNAVLTGFTISPDTNFIRKDEPFFPAYMASYTNYNAAIPNDNTYINVTVYDANVVQYNEQQHAFFAVADTGTTSAFINYNGFEDTITFVLLPKLNSGCINHTTGNTNFKSSLNWERSIVPASCDSVVVMPGHALTIDSSLQIRALYISPGATVLLSDSTVHLRVGEADYGNANFINNGTLIINNGQLTINGSLQLKTASNFTMTGGELLLDANTGYAITSLQNGKNIFDVSDGMNSFSFTGGKLQITDPPISSASQAIRCSYNFGDQSVLQFGDGVSVTASNNVNGFGSNLMPLRIGKLIVDAATQGNNRIFRSLAPLTIKSSLEVKSGRLVQSEMIQVIQ